MILELWFWQFCENLDSDFVISVSVSSKTFFGVIGMKLTPILGSTSTDKLKVNCTS